MKFSDAKVHHAVCPLDIAPAGEGISCRCPRYWPRKRRAKVKKICLDCDSYITLHQQGVEHFEGEDP
jgi:hypothetical protein